MQSRVPAILLIILLFASATSAFAAVDEVRLYVEGLACPFCTFGIEKRLKKVPGVVSLETTIRTGLVRVQLDPGATLDPAALNEAVKKAGFTPSRIEATVTGTLATRSEQPTLEASESGQTFRLVTSDSESSPRSLSAPMLVKLKSASADGTRPLTITGEVPTGGAQPSAALTVDSFEAAQ